MTATLRFSACPRCRHATPEGVGQVSENCPECGADYLVSHRRLTRTARIITALAIVLAFPASCMILLAISLLFF
jgi:hypothetical protein